MDQSECDSLVKEATLEVFSLLDHDIKNSKEFFAIALVTRRFIENHLALYDESINNNSQKLQAVYDTLILQLKELVKSIADQIRREETSFLEKERELLLPFLDQQKDDFTQFMYEAMKGIIRRLKTEGGLDLNKEISASARTLNESSLHLQAKALQLQNGVKKAGIFIALAGGIGAVVGSLLTTALLILAFNTGALSHTSTADNQSVPQSSSLLARN